MAESRSPGEPTPPSGAFGGVELPRGVTWCAPPLWTVVEPPGRPPASRRQARRLLVRCSFVAAHLGAVHGPQGAALTPTKAAERLAPREAPGPLGA